MFMKVVFVIHNVKIDIFQFVKLLLVNACSIQEVYVKRTASRSSSNLEV